MPALVALLRAVNVAGRTLPMKDLVQLFVAAGCTDVTTYIQSGNVVFRAPDRAVARLPTRITGAIEERFGFRAPLVLRTRAELAAAVAGSPFPAATDTTLHVLFLADAPTAERVRSLEPDRSPGDRFVVRGKDVYLFTPNGAGRSKLTADWFDRKLATFGTARNWRTVGVLLERVTALEAGARAAGGRSRS
jgi:uncharacterized protein (DUF1697 family)